MFSSYIRFKRRRRPENFVSSSALHKWHLRFYRADGELIYDSANPRDFKDFCVVQTNLLNLGFSMSVKSNKSTFFSWKVFSLSKSGEVFVFSFLGQEYFYEDVSVNKIMFKHFFVQTLLVLY